MSDCIGFKKVDYVQWYGVYFIVERLVNVFYIVYQQDVRECVN